VDPSQYILKFIRAHDGLHLSSDLGKTVLLP
jgi:hypothetical protein